MTDLNSTLNATIDTYLQAWTESDESRRTQLIAQLWSEDGRLIDPPATGEGHAGINGLFVGMQAQFPGHTFRRASAVDAHHEHFRFAWELLSPAGAVVLPGTDVGEFAADGRFKRITGFFGPLA